MEHLVGETLLQRVRRLRRLPKADMLRIARQIALSLHAAVPDPEAVGGERTKVLDLGIAKRVDPTNHQHTQSGVVLGTPSYKKKDSSLYDDR